MGTTMLSILFLTVTPPRISTVVVYPDRAQVTRTTALACGARAVATFEGIPPAADPGSFRARTSAGSVEGVRSEERVRAESFAAEVKDLDERIRKLAAEASALRDGRDRGQNAARIAAQYAEVTLGLVGREMTEAGPPVKAWEGALATVLDTRRRTAAEAVESGAKLRALGQELDDLRRRRQRLADAAARHDYVAEVLVSCPAGRTATVELAYVVGGAGWEPAYEARADEAAGAVELATWATVHQSTGEPWAKAQVILSTAVPRENATPPDLMALQVWAEERKPEKKVLVRREEQQRHAETGKDETKNTDARVGVRAQGLSVQLVVPEAADVAGDGTPARLLVARTRMKARFAYRTAPKLMPFVFRVADLVNSAPFPLLGGPLDAFRRGGLTSRYGLDRVAEGATFHLTFGAEESLRVKRVVVEEVQRDKGIFGGTRRFRFGYRFELANYLGRPEEVELAEHIPVSELDDVKVAVDPATTAGYATRPDDGILTWRLPLKAGEQRTIHLAFHVDVPSSYDSGAL